MKYTQTYVVIVAKNPEELSKLVTARLIEKHEILGQPGTTTTGYELAGGVSITTSGPSDGSRLVFAQALYHRAAHQLELAGQ